MIDDEWRIDEYRIEDEWGEEKTKNK